MNDRDVRFVEKKVDESWKEQAGKDKEKLVGSSQKVESNSPESATGRTPSEIKTSKELVNLITSLGYQAMMHLGQIPDPSTGMQEVNLELAKEVIDLLAILKARTQGNLSGEESRVISSILPELQMKYSQLL